MRLRCRSKIEVNHINGKNTRMSKKPSWDYVAGLLAAQTAMAEVTGKQKIDGMSEREWRLICELHCRLSGMSAAAAKEWEDSH